MFRRIKKICAIILILVLLPYVVTVFMNGETIEVNSPKLLDEYCILQLAQEVSSKYEDEMLKVQAVIVRTTMYQRVNEIDTENISYDEIDGPLLRRLQKAWEETEGQVLMYEGKLALLPFHYLSNGKTRDGVEVLQSDAYPYLKKLECLEDLTSENQIEVKMIEIANAKVITTDSAGYVTQVQVGEEIQSGDNFRNTYGLASSCFELQNFEQTTRVITKGIGHGLGLSQYTANEMAKEGKTYREILQFFYEGTEMQEVAEVLWNAE